MTMLQTNNLENANGVTFTKNPFLDQSINQRLPNNDNVPVQFDGTLGKTTTLQDFLKDQVYNAIAKFREHTKTENFATWEQFRAAMTEFTRGSSVSEQEIGQFWSSFNLDGKFYFSEQLLKLYGMPQ